VKIDSPTARALNPPSGASSTRKMISLIDDLAYGLEFYRRRMIAVAGYRAN
jgi:hypothetical protein